MHGVELASLCLGEVNALLCDDAQTGLFELGVDLASQVAACGIGFDDREGPFEGHGSLHSL